MGSGGTKTKTTQELEAPPARITPTSQVEDYNMTTRQYERREGQTSAELLAAEDEKKTSNLLG